MKWSLNNFDDWKKEHVDCFTSCLDLFSKDTTEYKQLKKCIDELNKLK